MQPAVRILMVEDSEDDAFLLLRELAGGEFEITHTRVDNLVALREALQTGDWDLLLSDFSLPTCSALDVLAVLRGSGRDVPCIVVSGSIGEEAAVEALRLGARDFVIKDRLARLLPAISRELREADERRKRRVAEQALLETRERMRFALEAVGVGTWESALVTGRITWSDALARLHGVPPGQFDGTVTAFLDRVHPDDRERVHDFLTRSGPGERDGRLEYRVMWPDGSLHWIGAIGRTFHDGEGKPLRAAGVSIDITVQRHLEEQFRQAQKMESVGQLAGGIAHDFNNLLTVVTGYCEMLGERLQDDPAGTEDLEEIRRAAERAAALTGQLLAFSRKQILDPQVVSLNNIVAGLHPMLCRLIEESVRIDVRAADDLAPVYVDPGQMEQVLLNLAVNARDAMPNGGVLTIETANILLNESYADLQLDVPSGAYVRLSVSDTGTGIPPEIQPHLFEPFFTTKPAGQGTGLGLATVYGIVKQSQGHIWFDTAPDKGTTFTVYLPVAENPPSPSSAARRPATTDLAGTETVLIVEDDSRLQALDVRILRRYGYNVLVASDGIEAQRVCKEHRGAINLVLMDVVMPGPSGRLTADWILQQRPETKIIYMSGYTDDAIAHHGVLDAGMNFLQKPFTPEILARKVRDALS
jgi:two-component system, cell cycle sensor histidine kinase and response regulator CckA